jgi:hypothetical protein
MTIIVYDNDHNKYKVIKTTGFTSLEKVIEKAFTGTSLHSDCISKLREQQIIQKNNFILH